MGHPHTVTKDGSRRAFSTQGSPGPLRDISLPRGDDRPLTPPVPSGNPVPSARSESLSSPYPSGTASSLSASTTTLRASSLSCTQMHPVNFAPFHARVAHRRIGTARRLPTPNPDASSTSFSATVAKDEVGTGGDLGAQTAFPARVSSANVLRNVMIVVGGSDRRECS